MTNSNYPTFVDLDPVTGQPTPTSYDSMRTSILGRHPVSDDLPADLRELQLAAVDYFALAYEQANAGRIHLYERLTNDAYLKAILSLELALRHRLGRGTSVTLKTLISDGIGSGLLPATNEYELIWKELRQNRNTIIHGNPKCSSYGPLTSRLIELVIDAVNTMYAAKIRRPSP